MRHTTILLLAFTFIFSYVQGQTPLTANQKRAVRWYFGYGAGLDFSTGNPVAITDGKLHTYEGCATMNDTLGNLLFYTDGDTIWNKNHQPMPNGTGLMGCGNFGSTAQACAIIPYPEHDSLYYVFTNDCWENGGAAGFRYNLINMNLNGGLGDVVQKNVLLYAPNTEGLDYTYTQDKKGYWVVTHGLYNNTFYSYKITKFGLDTNPVISMVGDTAIDNPTMIKISPNGNYLACALPDLIGTDDLFSFDNSTGIVYNPIRLRGKWYDNAYFGGGYYPIFSPDNSKLYYTISGSYIYQYCLDAGTDSISIGNTFKMFNHPDNTTYGYFAYGVDGKLYVASVFRDTVSVIENPNAYASACSLRTKSIPLNGKSSALGMPLFNSADFIQEKIINTCDSTASASIKENEFLSQTTKVYPNPSVGNVNIQFNHPALKPIQHIYMIDLLGRQTEIRFEAKSSTEYFLYTQDLSKGIYLLYVPEQPQLNSKIIISHF